MQRHPRHKRHDKYKSRITELLKSIDKDSDPQSQAHSAKYLAVLVSGYLEQAIKELLQHYASQGSSPQILRYIEETWPTSRNMSTGNIEIILHQFNKTWSEEFMTWLGQHETRKNHINSIVSWRNSIAHGQESNTTGVTLVSVGAAFSSIKDLVSFIESMVST